MVWWLSQDFKTKPPEPKLVIIGCQGVSSMKQTNGGTLCEGAEDKVIIELEASDDQRYGRRSFKSIQREWNGEAQRNLSRTVSETWLHFRTQTIIKHLPQTSTDSDRASREETRFSTSCGFHVPHCPFVPSSWTGGAVSAVRFNVQP